jgi:hypothetical protein
MGVSSGQVLAALLVLAGLEKHRSGAEQRRLLFFRHEHAAAAG